MLFDCYHSCHHAPEYNQNALPHLSCSTGLLDSTGATTSTYHNGRVEGMSSGETETRYGCVSYELPQAY